MRSPSQTVTEDDLRRLKLDVVAHRRQIDTLWATDSEMLRLLKAEESLLSREIARLERELRASKR